MSKQSKTETVGAAPSPELAAQHDYSKYAPKGKGKTPIRVNKGVPTPPGINFAQLPQAERDRYFLGLEHEWKGRYNKERGTVSLKGSQTWERG